MPCEHGLVAINGSCLTCPADNATVRRDIRDRARAFYARLTSACVPHGNERRTSPNHVPGTETSLAATRRAVSLPERP